MTGCFQPPSSRGNGISCYYIECKSFSSSEEVLGEASRSAEILCSKRGCSGCSCGSQQSPWQGRVPGGGTDPTAGLASLRALKHLISRPQPQFRFSASVPSRSQLPASPIAADVPGALLGRAWLRLPPSPAGSWGSRQGNATLSDLFGLRSLLLIC